MVVASHVIPYGSSLNALKSLPHASVENRVVTGAACILVSVRKGEAK